MDWALTAVIALVAFVLGYAAKALRGSGEDSFALKTPSRSASLAGTVPDELGQQARKKSNGRRELDQQTREEVEELILRNQKIQAIKLYREATKSGLKEAKDAVEEMQRQLMNPANSA